ncbi:PIG-L deacetylase family protein, partial [Parapedobacter sp.]
MKNKNTVLCLMAHPDDAEILSGGLLALLSRRGWQVAIATMTPGQAGSTQLNAEEISVVRRKEAAAAAAVIGGSYRCLESEDVFILYDKPTLMKVIALFREIQPTLVITASPDDYMLDHEVTSHLAQTACMAATIPNIATPGLPLLAQVPHLYYADAVQGKDRYGRQVVGDVVVDISDVIAIKEEMLCCHHSQRDWLRSISKVDEFVLLMKSFSERNG